VPCRKLCEAPRAFAAYALSSAGSGRAAVWLEGPSFTGQWRSAPAAAPLKPLASC
jgi:hypothetical protein